MADNTNIQSIVPLIYDLQTYFLQVQALSNIDQAAKSDLDDLNIVSRHALRMIDYALVSVDANQLQLPLTNVSASAIANDVTASLLKLAKAYEVDLRVETTKTMEPIYTNEAAAKGILYGLAASLITRAQESSVGKKRPIVVIAAQETTPKTQRLGVYSPHLPIGSGAIKTSTKLERRSRSVSPADFHHSGLGLVVSQQLSNQLGQKLQRFEHRGNRGIGFYAPMSMQLKLV